MASILGMMKGMLEITLINTQVLQDLHINSQILITGLLLLFPRMRQIMIMLRMTHRPGVATLHGIDLHLGQNTKLGGRYADISLIYISYFDRSFVYPYFAFFCCSCFISIS